MSGFQDSKKYRIQNVQDGLYLDIGGEDGVEILSSPLTDQSQNVFIGVKAEQEDGFILLTTLPDLEEELALDKSTDTDLVSLYPKHGDLHQVWIPVSAGDDLWIISSARDGLALQSQGDSNQVKCVEPNPEDPSQQWRIIPEN